MMSETRSLSDLGRFGLTEYILEKCREAGASGRNSDDDAILLTEEETLSTSVLFLEGINFDLIYTPLQHLGYKVITAAVTNILAMNGRPSGLSVSLGISNKLNLQMIEQLMDGVFSACRDYGVSLEAFKPAPSLTGLTIAATLTGKVRDGAQYKRSGAQETDVICVSGDLGAALLGLHLLEREKKVLKSSDSQQPEFGDNDYVLRRQLKPEARVDVIEKLTERGIKPTAMTAVTEGLATSLLLLCRASDKGCRIYESKLPIHQKTLKASSELNYNPLIAALNGGEDYELLLTLPLKVYEAKSSFVSGFLTPIGYINEASKACRMIITSNEETDLKSPGWGKLYQ